MDKSVYAVVAGAVLGCVATLMFQHRNSKTETSKAGSVDERLVRPRREVKTTLTVCDHPSLYAYMKDVSLRLDETQERLFNAIRLHPHARLSSAPDESQFLGNLAHFIGAKRIIEVGVYMGFTTLSLAKAVPADGTVVALDVSDEFTSLAKPFWKAAGVADRIDLRLAPAADTMRQLLNEQKTPDFDFIFIDADKVNYDVYYELGLQLLRKGGVIAVDNVLWSGRVIDPSNNDPDTVAIRQLNQKLKNDRRVSITIVPIADGVTLLEKL